jgi:hypothetical protein
MHTIHPKIVTDEQMQPIAVQIDYADWLEIKKLLLQKKSKAAKNLEKFAGSIDLTEDPLKYQKKYEMNGNDQITRYQYHTLLSWRKIISAFT